MKIAVLGLWHLGCVTAACAARHFQVVGVDASSALVAELSRGHAPLSEPGLDELLRAGLESGRLRFTTDAAGACSGARILWVTHDAPVDDDDRTDVESVLADVRRCALGMARGTLVLLSTQLPVGTCRRLETELAELGLRFACSPENLCLGDAVANFENPDRVIIGCRDARSRAELEELFRPFSSRIIWMRPESAEMTKHAINSFLALSITYINEVARLCEVTGADAKEVEAGLKSERRIGPRAYLSPSGPFAGGTLARDVVAFIDTGARHQVQLEVIPAIKRSNDVHRRWILTQIQRSFAGEAGRSVMLLGLTYKPGTNTLRRSAAVELARELDSLGFRVRASDPSQAALSPALGFVEFHPNPADGVAGADALVVCTPWPEYLALDWRDLLGRMRQPLVIDVGRFLEKSVAGLPNLRYITIGSPS
jgi:UDPglucose 6-dehydrogenase